MTVTLLRGNALALPLADNTVDLVCTSPPYFALRAYSDNGEAYDGQLGSEATPAEYVDALLAATREMVRVTKPNGSIFVNLGDKYATNDNPRNGTSSTLSNATTHVARTDAERVAWVGRTLSSTSSGIPRKSLIGIPWRYALRCIDGSSGLTPIVVKMLLRDVALGVMSLADAEAMVDEIDRTDPDDLGLILRAEIVLDKKNGLPESVTDRVRRSHEQVFHFVKQPRYYSAVDEIRVEAKYPGDTRHLRGSSYDRTMTAHINSGPNPLGALPGSVWEYVSQPFTAPSSLGIDHFAAFNMALPRRIIRGWSPPGICVACGDGRRPVGERERFPLQAIHNGHTTAVPGAPDGRSSVPHGSRTTITGYACGCPDTTAPTRPSVVLDPFSGTGTTCLVADVLGRHGIGIDMSSDYCRLAKWRTTDPAERAKAMQVDKPPAEVDGQGDLFGEMSA